MFGFFRDKKKYADAIAEYISSVFKSEEEKAKKEIPCPKPAAPKPVEETSPKPTVNSDVRWSIGSSRSYTSPTPPEPKADSDVRWSISSRASTTPSTPPKEPKVRYQLGDNKSNVRYSIQSEKSDVRWNIVSNLPDDKYNEKEISKILSRKATPETKSDLSKDLEKSIDQSFVGRLITVIRESGMSDPQIYRAAQIDKRLFSKILSNRDYHPSKDTIIALAIAMKLPLSAANDLLSRAGYLLSHSDKRDIIIEFFFKKQIYNLTTLNDHLNLFAQRLIGRNNG